MMLFSISGQTSLLHTLVTVAAHMKSFFVAWMSMIIVNMTSASLKESTSCQSVWLLNNTCLLYVDHEDRHPGTTSNTGLDLSAFTWTHRHIWRQRGNYSSSTGRSVVFTCNHGYHQLCYPDNICHVNVQSNNCSGYHRLNNVMQHLLVLTKSTEFQFCYGNMRIFSNFVDTDLSPVTTSCV